MKLRDECVKVWQYFFILNETADCDAEYFIEVSMLKTSL